MKRYHLIRSVAGGSDVYDEEGRQVGYSLPAVIGGGEDFYDMQGNPVGQSFDSAFGGEAFTGFGDGSHGFMDGEILMGRNAWLEGDPFGRPEEPGFPGDGGPDGGDGFGPDWE